MSSIRTFRGCLTWPRQPLMAGARPTLQPKPRSHGAVCAVAQQLQHSALPNLAGLALERGGVLPVPWTLAAISYSLSATRLCTPCPCRLVTDLLTQLMAALPVLGECCTLAVVARLPSEATAQFARCGVLIAGDSSRAVLSNWLTYFAPMMRNPVGPTTPADRLPSTYYNLSTATMQLQAADRLLQLLEECGGSGRLAAVAADVWTPEAVTRWLASILVVVHAGKDAGAWATAWLVGQAGVRLQWLDMCHSLRWPGPPVRATQGAVFARHE